MAGSPSHKFGQIIGDRLEAAVAAILEKFACDTSLYLDRKGSRPARPGKKCAWVDVNGNSHDLDFVLERGGSPEQIGDPVAFIETAWRRSTRHSRNKVQEIQGAIDPLVMKFQHLAPFKGAVLMGEFTSGALEQLRSLRYSILHISYQEMTSIFKQFGIDATFEDDTEDRLFLEKIKRYEQLTPTKQLRLTHRLIDPASNKVQDFLNALRRSISRKIERVVILALSGSPFQSSSITQAVRFIENFQPTHTFGTDIVRYEIEVRYNNGDCVKGSFHEKIEAVEFLKSY